MKRSRYCSESFNNMVAQLHAWIATVVRCFNGGGGKEDIGKTVPWFIHGIVEIALAHSNENICFYIRFCAGEGSFVAPSDKTVRVLLLTFTKLSTLNFKGESYRSRWQNTSESFTIATYADMWTTARFRGYGKRLWRSMYLMRLIMSFKK